MSKAQYKNMKGTKNGHQVPPPLALYIGDREYEQSLMNSDNPSDIADERADSMQKASSKNVERDAESKNRTFTASSHKDTSGAEEVKQWLRRNKIKYDHDKFIEEIEDVEDLMILKHHSCVRR